MLSKGSGNLKKKILIGCGIFFLIIVIAFTCLIVWFANMIDDSLSKKEIFELVETITKDTSYHPKEESKWLTYNQIDAIFKMDENVDYYALPSQVNQQTIEFQVKKGA